MADDQDDQRGTRSGRPGPTSEARSVCGCAVVAVVVLVVAVVLLANHARARPITSLRDLEQRTDIKFPTDTVLLYAWHKPGFALTTLAKLQMATAAFWELVADPAYGFEGAPRYVVMSGGRCRDHGIPVEEWRPEAAQRWTAMDTWTDASDTPTQIALVADLDDPETAVVYFQWTK